MLEIDIRKRVAGFTIDVRLDVATEVVALFGPSGSGKSMTLKMVAGIEQPDEGVIRFGERVLFERSAGIDEPARHRRVGYVPQHYALFPHLSALENVTLALRKGRQWKAADADRRGRELLELFGLSGQLDARPGRLSGGQQQRVALARALATEPEILLLDEPFAALDGPIRADLRWEFLALRRRLGVPAIFVTHDLEEAALLADRMAVLIAGEVHQVGPPREVLTRPRDRQVAALVQARNILPGVLVRSEGLWARTAAGMLRVVASGQGLDVGAEIDAIIRPETIRIVHEDRPVERLRDDTIVAGVVAEVVDYGTRTLVHVDVQGVTLEISVTATSTRRVDLHAGQPVRLAIPAGDVHVVAASGSQSSVG